MHFSKKIFQHWIGALVFLLIAVVFTFRFYNQPTYEEYLYDPLNFETPETFVYDFQLGDTLLKMYMKHELIEKEPYLKLYVKSYMDDFEYDSVISVITENDIAITEAYMFQFDSIAGEIAVVVADSSYHTPIYLDRITDYEAYIRYPLVNSMESLHIWNTLDYLGVESTTYKGETVECLVFEVEDCQVTSQKSNPDKSAGETQVHKMYLAKGQGVIKRVYNDSQYLLLNSIIKD